MRHGREVDLPAGHLVYYAALAMVCRRLPEAMYSIFILGNLLYNDAALLVF